MCLHNLICMLNKLIIDIVKKELHVVSEHTHNPEGRGIIKTYPIIAGRNSHLGAKEREGDQRTPRGDYYICTINERSQFTLFFGISYPDVKDAMKGFEDGIISPVQKDEILAAAALKQRPPWNTPLGGEVGIHGGGIDRDGTRGCIGMQDADVLDLRKFVKLGMEVQLIYFGESGSLVSSDSNF